VEYGCRVRTLIRTVGIAAGLTLAASAFAENTVASKATKALPESAYDSQSESDGRYWIRRLPGGAAPEGYVAPSSERGVLCSLDDATQCYSRPAPFAPVTIPIVGEFNADTFVVWDDFVASASGDVTSICWSAQFSDDEQCGLQADPMAQPGDEGQWIVEYFSTTAGFPGSSIGGPFQTGQGGVTVQFEAGSNDLGFGFPEQFETKWTMSHPAVAVSAGTCYWISFDWNPEAQSPCFQNIVLSYENDLGNRRSLILDISDMQPPAIKDLVNEDVAVCIGIVNGGAVPLANSNNEMGGACTMFVEGAGNDDVNSAITIACGSQITNADNRFATIDAAWGLEPPCRIGGADLNVYTSGDFWYVFTATHTSASISTCATQGEVGLAGGNSIIELYTHTMQPPPAGPWVPAQFTRIACSDNACGVYSDATSFSLVVGQTYYARIMSWSGNAQGLYNITLECPVPVAPNAFCADAINVPPTGVGGGWQDLQGTIFEASTRTGELNTNPGACVNPTFPTDTPVLANTSRGVWYKLTGIGGTRVDISTDNTLAGGGTIFNTRLTVYCSPSDSCGDLACLNADEDINPNTNNTRSRVEICALDGKTYYIYVHGNGSQVGEFACSFRQVVDGNQDPVLCCDDQPCINFQEYTIPAGSVAELEGCDNAATGGGGGMWDTDNNSGCNIPAAHPLVAANPNGAGTWTGLMEEGPVGVTVVASTRSFSQFVDNDWFVLRNLPPAPTSFIFDSEGSFEPPVRYFPFALNTNFRNCLNTAAFSPQTTATLGARLGRRWYYNRELTGVDEDGTTGVDANEMAVQIRNNITAGFGYPCGASDSYWTRVNYVLPMADCNWHAPFGELTASEYFDEAIVGTWNMDGGSLGYAIGEPCDPMDPNHRSKTGCFDNGLDGDFITLNLIDDSLPYSVGGSAGAQTGNGPTLGRIDGVAGPGGAQRDFDIYRFQVDVPSDVRIESDCGGAFQFIVTEDTCDLDNSDTLGAGGTSGRCGARRGFFTSHMVLPAGTYQLWAFGTDPLTGSGIFGTYQCSDPVSPYLIYASATPLPECTPTGTMATKEDAENPCPLQFMPDATCDPLNDGCIQDAWGADSISSGNTVLGTLFTTYLVPPEDIFIVDQDYYEFTVNVPSQLKITGSANGPVRFQVLDTGVNGANCLADISDTVRVLASFNATSCDAGSPVEHVTYLAPGTYSVVAAPGSTEFGLLDSVLDCNNAEERTYNLTIQTAAIGCCTIGSGDINATASECSNLGGAFNATPCSNEYMQLAPRGTCGGLVSISGSGTRVDGGNSGTTPKVIGDEDILNVPIGFSFNYMGQDYTQIGISSNGFLVMGGGETNSALPRAFPADSQPNAIVAPFWANWSAYGHSGADFGVWTQLTGGVGNGVLTVEWYVGCDSNSFISRARFQVLLYEATGNIEFRYGTFENLVGSGAFDDDTETYSAGVEDYTGLRGLNLPVDSNFLANGNTCFLVSAGAPFVCCLGNANGDNVVDFDDLVAVLGNWLESSTVSTPNNDGDADCNGDVDFDDIVAVLGEWLNACP